MGCKYTICAFNCSLLLLPLNKSCKEQQEVVPMHPVALPTHVWELLTARALLHSLRAESFVWFCMLWYSLKVIKIMKKKMKKKPYFTWIYQD
jgi:hypothetical protein